MTDNKRRIGSAKTLGSLCVDWKILPTFVHAGITTHARNNMHGLKFSQVLVALQVSVASDRAMLHDTITYTSNSKITNQPKTS